MNFNFKTKKNFFFDKSAKNTICTPYYGFFIDIPNESATFISCSCIRKCIKLILLHWGQIAHSAFASIS